VVAGSVQNIWFNFAKFRLCEILRSLRNQNFDRFCEILAKFLEIRNLKFCELFPRTNTIRSRETS
jgi:hypothetical protein